MKLKTTKFLIVGIMILFLSMSFSTVKSENSGNYEISISSTSTEYVKTVQPVTDVKYEKYDISIEIFNKGPSETDDLTVRLIDDENIRTDRKVIIAPSETETVTFEQLPLLGTDTHSAEIQILDSQNSTLEKYTIHFNKEGPVDPKEKSSQTPGFEIMILIASILLSTEILKRKK